MSYGIELRERVINFVLEGRTMQEAHKIFKVHYNTVSKWLNISDEIIAPLVYANNLNTRLFNCYLQIILLPLLAFGTVIVMDNARYQRGVAPPLSEETKKLIEKMVNTFTT